MKKYLLAASVFVTAAATLHAQNDKTTGVTLQYFVTGQEGAPGPATTIRMIGIDGVTGGTVTGKPLSATEERHTLQVLGDGTRIENTETDRFFRDDQGRTRVEHPDGRVLIQNPVDGSVVELRTQSKTARRLNQGFQMKLDAEKRATAPRFVVQALVKGEISSATASATGESVPQSNEENLGLQSVNGVTAEGRRNTNTIPAHEIGNDRPIQVVSERWFSPDLKMLVRSTNSDPRFGETSYQLNNINQAAPDPSLFQIPAHYTTMGAK